MALFSDDSVLVRTEEGESAAKQPRRVASNRARAALLLLDGQLSVGEMKRRFGESLEVEDALMELLRDGLAVDRDDAITDTEEDLPVADVEAGPDEPPTEMPPDPDLSLPPGFVVASKGKRSKSDDDTRSDRMDEGETPRDARREPPTDEVGAPELDLDASISAAYGSDEAVAKAPAGAKEPSILVLAADRLRYYLTHALRGATALLIAAVIGALLVVVFKAPEWSRSGIEARARVAAGAEVRIERLGAAWSSGPALRLSGVRVGDGPEAIAIDSVVVVPDWFALASRARLGLLLRMEGISGQPTPLAVAFNRADFARLGALRLAIEDLRLRLSDRSSLLLSGEGEISDGVLQELSLRVGEGVALRVPMPLSFPLEFSGSANNWRAPFLPELALESIQFDALLSDEALQVVSLGGAVHGGRYGGTLEIAWTETFALQGELILEGVRLERLMPAMRPAGDLEGALSGTVQLASEAESFSALRQAMKVTSRIEVDRGRFGGLDVGAIMRERGTGVVRGGATRFDSMRAEVSMDMDDRELRAVIRRLDAGNLHVVGGLVIRPDDELSGRLTSMLSTSERSVSLPVVVSGSLGAPALRLAREAIQ